MMLLRRAVVPPARFAVGQAVRLRTRSWRPSSHFFAVGERTGWSVDEDARHLEATARRLGYDVAPARWARYVERQSVFSSSHFDALGPHWRATSHRLATAYLHGRPGTAGFPEFDAAFEALRRDPGRLARIQVSHSEMHDLVLSAGVDPGRVFRIPIGIDLEHFPLGDGAARATSRAALGVPSAAFVVGSFQKDGVGWGEGLQPKAIKGPDVLVAALERVQECIPELFVLLTGPARGYVRRELVARGILHRHVFARSRSELARAYYALDAYLVASRQEGGPKAALESMASGVPLVSTRVGQAQELVVDGSNGLLADVDDVETLAGLVIRLAEDDHLRSDLVRGGRPTAESLAYECLDDRWAALFEGFVDRGDDDGR